MLLAGAENCIKIIYNIILSYHSHEFLKGRHEISFVLTGFTHQVNLLTNQSGSFLVQLFYSDFRLKITLK